MREEVKLWAFMPGIARRFPLAPDPVRLAVYPWTATATQGKTASFAGVSMVNADLELRNVSLGLGNVSLGLGKVSSGLKNVSCELRNVS